VNERVLDVRGEELPTTDFLCECGNLDCIESVPLTRNEYERVRANASLFVIAPGHAIPQVETIVESSERFQVALKDPEERRISEATDPRAD
jgi:hypothetical protein